MHRLNKILLAAALVVSLCLCQAALAEGFYSSLPVAGITTSSTITVDMPGENPVIDGINPLTGEAWIGSYTPILVNIDTHPDGWPHWGTASADITYEMPLQSDGSTRSVAVFLGDIPRVAGPVRSGRVPMASLREMWDGAWVFYGWQNKGEADNVLNLTVDVDEYALHLHSDARVNGRWVFPYVEGTEANYGGFFARSKDHIAPHNVQISLYEVQNLFSQFGKVSTPHPFKFTTEGLDHGTDVNHIRIEHKTTSPAYISEYYFDEMTGDYVRYRNGQQDYDLLNNMNLTYANVIVLRTNVSWYNNNPARPVIPLVGQGTAEIFQNGKYIRGTWARGASRTPDANNLSDLASRMVFFDDMGNELEFKVGKTFIQIVPNEQAVIVSSAQQIAGGIAQATPVPTATPEPTRVPGPTRTPRSDGATPAPVVQAEDEDQEFVFGN